MKSLSQFTIGLIAAACIASLAYAVAMPFCRAASRKAILEAMFEAFFGAFLACMFAYPTIRGLIEGRAWFVTKLGAVAVNKAANSSFYWSIESFGAAAALLGALIMFTGIRKFRRARK